MLRKSAKVELLRSVPLFARCPRRELDEIAKLADEIDVAAGKAFVREGEPGREFFVVVDGEVEARRNGRKLRTLGAGDVVGELALVLDRPRSATVTATVDTTLLVLTARNFKTLMERSPTLRVRVLEALAERVEPAGIA